MLSENIAFQICWIISVPNSPSVASVSFILAAWSMFFFCVFLQCPFRLFISLFLFQWSAKLRKSLAVFIGFIWFSKVPTTTSSNFSSQTSHYPWPFDSAVKDSSGLAWLLFELQLFFIQWQHVSYKRLWAFSLYCFVPLAWNLVCRQCWEEGQNFVQKTRPTLLAANLHRSKNASRFIIQDTVGAKSSRLFTRALNRLSRSLLKDSHTYVAWVVVCVNSINEVYKN